MMTTIDSACLAATSAPRLEGELILSDCWMLTRRHGDIAYAIPVLVHRQTGEAYSRSEPVASETGGEQSASELVSGLIAELPAEVRHEARRYLLEPPQQ
jgi:hypothetical protein